MRPYIVRNITRNLLKQKKTSLLFQRSFSVAASSTADDIVLQSPHAPIPSVDGLTIPELVWHNLPIKENEIAIVSDLVKYYIHELNIIHTAKNNAVFLITGMLNLGSNIDPRSGLQAEQEFCNRSLEIRSETPGMCQRCFAEYYSFPKYYDRNYGSW